MTGEEWDTHEWRILNDLLRDGVPRALADHIASEECTVQFGPHPEDVAS